MTWTALIPLIARYGIEWSYEFWKTIQNKEQPTEADWQSLIALANKPMVSYLEDAEMRAKQASDAGKVQ